jgi:hypothetical protein
MSDLPTPQRREFIYRMIQFLMLGDVLLGLALLALGLFVVDFPALAVGGAVLAAMGLGLTLVFRLLARRVATDAPKTRESPNQLRR